MLRRSLPRPLLTLLLLGLAFDASAALPREDLARLKTLQRQLMITEPAERSVEREERLERFKKWRQAQKKKHLPVGDRLRVAPDEGVGDLVRNGGFSPDYFARARTSARSSISAVSNVLANDTTGENDGSCQSEVSIAAIGNQVVAAWNDGADLTASANFQGWAYSSDGGATWTDGGAPPNSGIGLWSSDPVLTVNAKTGDFYFAALADQGVTTGVGLVRGRFTGSVFNWGTPGWAVQLNSNSFCPDKEWVVADSTTGNLYITFTHFIGPCSGPSSDEISFVRSTNNGVSWSAPLAISSASDAGFVQGSRPAVGAAPNEVYVVWHAIGQSDNSAYGRDFLRVRRSIDGGQNFLPEVTADSIFSNFGTGGPGFNRGRGITFPAIAVDRSNGPHRGRAFLTWNESVDFYSDDYPRPGISPSQSEKEPNDDSSIATSFGTGSVLRGTIAIPSDLDYWRWNATQGTTYIFFLDSLYVALDASFRVFSTTGGTNLAFSQNGQGGKDFLVFTAPTSDVYYLRVGSYSQRFTGKYRILTTTHVAQASDRARDQRDVFVKYTDNGITWGPTVRVNDDPGYLDDYLPEVAVDVGGRVFASCYDWRDASPAEEGGASSAYLYRSDNGGTSWVGGTRIQDVPTNWTATYSTLIPNQGDYIGMTTTDSTVFVGWADGRGDMRALNDPRGTKRDPDVYIGATRLNCVGAAVSLVSTSVGPDSILVTWSAAAATPAELFRSAGTGAWADLGPVVADGTGHIVYNDKAVTSGQTYAYRLGVTGFCELFVGAVWGLKVPFQTGPALAIHGTRPNPTPDDVVVSFTLPSNAPAKLALYDLTGREVASADVTALGAGTHVFNLTQGKRLRSGIYFVRLTQGGSSSKKRVAVFP